MPFSINAVHFAMKVNQCLQCILTELEYVGNSDTSIPSACLRGATMLILGLLLIPNSHYSKLGYQNFLCITLLIYIYQRNRVEWASNCVHF